MESTLSVWEDSYEEYELNVIFLVISTKCEFISKSYLLLISTMIGQPQYILGGLVLTLLLFERNIPGNPQKIRILQLKSYFDIISWLGLS